MKVWTQLVRWCRCHSRRIGPAASLLLLGLLTLSGPVAAQEGETRAGLVVQFGDGTVQTACVDLGSDGEGTGEELLRATGLNVLIDYTSGFGGGTVCKIGGQGCDFPGEDCFCQCSMKPGDPCVYWVYFDQVDGQWRYSNQGASIVVVNPGDVQGWVWGAGSANAGVFPPLITFDQICSGSAAVDAPHAGGDIYRRAAHVDHATHRHAGCYGDAERSGPVADGCDNRARRRFSTQRDANPDRNRVAGTQCDVDANAKQPCDPHDVSSGSRVRAGDDNGGTGWSRTDVPDNSPLGGGARRTAGDEQLYLLWPVGRGPGRRAVLFKDQEIA
jgi:hypothetical protein